MASPKGTLTALQVELATAFARRAPGFFLTGGAVLAGWELAHRTTDDLDWFTDDDASMQAGEPALRGAVDEVGGTVEAMTTSPDFRRFKVQRADETLKVDLVRDRAAQLAAKVSRDGIRSDSVEEIFANKICALVERSEPRDLFDLMFLERRGLRVEDHLAAAQRKDGGATAATLAWLLGSLVLEGAASALGNQAELEAFRVELQKRLLALAVPPRR